MKLGSKECKILSISSTIIEVETPIFPENTPTPLGFLFFYDGYAMDYDCDSLMTCGLDKIDSSLVTTKVFSVEFISKKTYRVTTDGLIAYASIDGYNFIQ